MGEFWGKAHPAERAGAGAHPLVAHALDVAAVAVLLGARIIPEMDGRMLGFLVALHDIGKFSRPFQALSELNWPTMVLGPFPHHDRPPAAPRHDALGALLLEQEFSNRFDDLLPVSTGEWTHGARGHLWRALAGHHGQPPSRLDMAPGAKVLCASCRGAASAFIDAMREIFRPRLLPAPESDLNIASLGWRLAGLTTAADWIGSRQTWFPYVTRDAVEDPARYYWNEALPRAAAALAEAGLGGVRAERFRGLRGLFPKVTHPSETQSWAETAGLTDGPILAVIEDATGSGKTEAAMTLAHRLIATGRAGGVFFALPTMATANAMFGRLASAYRGLFAPETNPSLALAHGRADLDLRFARALQPGSAYAPHVTDPADEPAEAQCAAWLAADRRRALLAQVGVGTLDQALLAVLPVRHAPLRLFGLTGKVLIVDEVHAYDVYMARELEALLRFHAALGGSAILLSATLPRVARERLARAFRDGLDMRAVSLKANAYPLATVVSRAGASETPCALRPGLARAVSVTRLPDTDAALGRIEAAVLDGAAVAWVRNTVDEAIAAAAALRERGLMPLLFHARFAMADRLAIEAAVLRRFGRDGDAGDRPGVLVATQVVEQSLDIDFDLLVSDLAPVDLLIQRAGRLWRHDRNAQGRPVAVPELLVISPEPVDDPPADWLAGAFSGTQAVYRDPALLWRSARALFARGVLMTPDDMRPLVEVAFDAEREGAVPPGLAKASARAFGEDLSHAEIARQNVLDPRRGYDRDAGLWDREERTPTRLEREPRVTLRLARVEGGALVPYASDPDADRAWALSEVNVAHRHVGACPPPPDLVSEVERVRATWPAWERDSETLLLIILQPDGEGFSFAVRKASENGVLARYDRWGGLRWT
jgi:CRISPR-associated endonuclease/helicase Cas3